METNPAGDIIGNLVAAIGQVEQTDGIRLSAREILDWWYDDGLISEAEYRAVLLRYAVAVAA